MIFPLAPTGLVALLTSQVAAEVPAVLPTTAVGTPALITTSFLTSTATVTTTVSMSNVSSSLNISMSRTWTTSTLSSSTSSSLPVSIEVSSTVSPPAETSSTVPVPGLNADQQKALDMHNAARRAVGNAPLAWSASLAADAQAYAQKLTAIGGLVHDEENDSQGENLYYHFGSSEPPYTAATTWWLNEISLYDGQPIPESSPKGNFEDYGHYSESSSTPVSSVTCENVKLTINSPPRSPSCLALDLGSGHGHCKLCRWEDICRGPLLGSRQRVSNSSPRSTPYFDADSALAMAKRRTKLRELASEVRTM